MHYSFQIFFFKKSCDLCLQDLTEPMEDRQQGTLPVEQGQQGTVTNGVADEPELIEKAKTFGVVEVSYLHCTLLNHLTWNINIIG